MDTPESVAQIVLLHTHGWGAVQPLKPGGYHLSSCLCQWRLSTVTPKQLCPLAIVLSQVLVMRLVHCWYHEIP